MATKWSKKKVNPDNINSGNEYEKGDRVSVQALNSMVESGLYSQEFAEAIVDTPDTSEAGNVGTPAVSFIDNVKNGNTYKKFKFSNLKGATGAKIVSTEFQGQDANGGNIYKQTFDNDYTAMFTAPKGAKGDSGSPYANTSEGQISGLNLNSSSTLADLATQLLAVQTRVVSAPIGNNITSANATALRRLLGGAPFNGTYERVEFKVFSQVTGFEKIIDVVGLKQSTSTPKVVHGQLVYNDAGEGYEWQWTGWSTEPHPVGSIYQSTSSTSPSSLFGGTWEQIGKTGIPQTNFNTVATDVAPRQEPVLQEMTIPANNAAFIFGAIQSALADPGHIMSCVLRVYNASTNALISGYDFTNRTTMESGGGASISFYFPAVDYACKVKLMSYGYRDSTTRMVSTLQVVRIPQEQFVWKRIG